MFSHGTYLEAITAFSRELRRCRGVYGNIRTWQSVFSSPHRVSLQKWHGSALHSAREISFSTRLQNNGVRWRAIRASPTLARQRDGRKRREWEWKERETAPARSIKATGLGGVRGRFAREPLVSIEQPRDRVFSAANASRVHDPRTCTLLAREIGKKKRNIDEYYAPIKNNAHSNDKQRS